jgi:hypothetical protein
MLIVVESEGRFFLDMFPFEPELFVFPGVLVDDFDDME